MYLKLTHNLICPILALAVFSMCSAAFAQGTATGPNTIHNVDPGPIVVIGDFNNPFPIDLDANGQPWTKHIDDPNLLMINGGPLDIVETIINVGTEPWFDWHEHILPDPTGIVPGVWTNVSLTVNGNLILFNPTGLNSPDLWLDNFSQPVLPGDILQIRKQVDTFATSALFTMTIEEYPTPEPASAALVGLGSLLVLCRRRAALGRIA